MFNTKGIRVQSVKVQLESNRFMTKESGGFLRDPIATEVNLRAKKRAENTENSILEAKVASWGNKRKDFKLSCRDSNFDRV